MQPRDVVVVPRGRIEARAGRLLESRLTHEPNVRLQKHLSREHGALSTFLHRPEVEATNWRGEQAIRPAVVNRKTSGGSRSDAGADAQGILTSVFRTARPLDLGLARGPGGRPRFSPLPRGQPELAAA